MCRIVEAPFATYLGPSQWLNRFFSLTLALSTRPARTFKRQHLFGVGHLKRYVATNHHQTYHPPPSSPRPFQGIADVVETLLEDVDSYLDEASGKGANQQVSATPSLAILENQINLRRAFMTSSSYV